MNKRDTTHYDVILVLGCGMHENDELYDDAKVSMQIAKGLYDKGAAPRIIISGYLSYKATFTPPMGESDAMKDYGTKIGIPANVMYVERDSKDTIGNFYFSKQQYLLPNNYHRILIVPGPNQLRLRLTYLVRKILGVKYQCTIYRRRELRLLQIPRELYSLRRTMRLLKGVAPGEDAEIIRRLRLFHPGYKVE